MNADTVVIGGGLVGSAIAYGLAGRGTRVMILDGGDRDFRASTANAGLVWVHGKGMNMPPYQNLTRASAGLWPNFSAELRDTTGIDVQYESNGGLAFCLSEGEFENRRADLLRLHAQSGSSVPDWEMLDRSGITKLLPKVQLGPGVVGASFGHLDGQTNSLRLLAALHLGIQKKGGQLRGGSTVRSVKGDGHAGFTIYFDAERISCQTLVIAAGLGSTTLAEQVGLLLPIKPQRGQMLVTERLDPFLPLPLLGVSQTQQGTVLIGATHEDVGFDNSTTCGAASAMSAHAIRRLPALSEVRVARHWAGLRIMTPDGFPVYAESESSPGAFVAACHSGVTLAAAHAGLLADAIEAGQLPLSFEVFHHRRFDVQKAA